MFRRTIITSAAAMLLLSAVAARSQPSPDDLTVVEMYQEAVRRVNAQNFAGLEPYLKGLIDALEPYAAENPDAAKAVEFARFYLGMSPYAEDRMDVALQRFEDYIARYPGGTFTASAYLMCADAYAAQDKWEKVLEQLEAAMRHPSLALRQRTAVLRMAGETLFRLEKWERSLQVMQEVYRTTRKAEERLDATVYICLALIELQRYGELFAFLPEVRDSDVMYDIDLNISLIEAADQLAEKEQRLEALQLYQSVLPKEELLAHVETRIVELRKLLDQPPDLGQDPLDRLQRQKALRRRVEAYEARAERIREYPDYAVPLQFRMAVCYYEMERPWEAYALFRRIFDRHRDHELAEQACYSAISILREQSLLARLVSEAKEYIEAFPGGEYASSLGKLILDISLAGEDYREAWREFNYVRALKLTRLDRNEVLLTAGYIAVQMEQWDRARETLQIVLKRRGPPGQMQQAIYWKAMCLLFKSDYQGALEEFTAFLEEYPSGGLAEDAVFRVAVCHYGLGDLETAESLLRDFIAKYPGSSLEAEALNMTADIAAGEGRLDEAVDLYARTERTTDDMTQINYAVFQQARLLELEGRFDEIISLFDHYIAAYGVEGNPIEATYWIANALKQSGRDDEAMETFYDAIVRHGDDVNAEGIDMMIRDLIEEFRSRDRYEARTAFLDRLYGELEKARAAKRRTLWMRLDTLFAEIRPKQRDALAESMMRAFDFSAASPITLRFIGDYAMEKNRKDFAREIYRHFLATFPQSDLALPAYRQMATFYLEEGETMAALPLLEEISSRYAQFEDAGWATIQLARIYQGRGEHARAAELYETVLAVKEWRGEAWAEALYRLGETLREQGKAREAFAYFQRVYVMYAGYPEWAARAYVASAECLVQFGRMQEAVNTYRELLSRDLLRGTEVYPQALASLKALEERMP